MHPRVRLELPSQESSGKRMVLEAIRLEQLGLQSAGSGGHGAHTKGPGHRSRAPQVLGEDLGAAKGNKQEEAKGFFFPVGPAP